MQEPAARHLGDCGHRALWASYLCGSNIALAGCFGHRLLAQLTQGVVATPGQLAGHGECRPLALEAGMDGFVAMWSGELWRAAVIAACGRAQRRAGGPCLARCPAARLPSEDQTVTSRPARRTTWSEREKRRQSPSSDQMTTAVSGPMP